MVRGEKSRDAVLTLIPARVQSDEQFWERVLDEQGVPDDMRAFLQVGVIDAIVRLPDGATVAVGPPRRVSPGFLYFPLSRPWRRRAPAKTNYRLNFDGSIHTAWRTGPNSAEYKVTPFRIIDLVPTGELAEHCDDCGATSFTVLRDRDHDSECGWPL